tara:strand:+ start:48 stop:680 length:633 start_codon:yes stop_codon:yes gene_type:complete
MAGGANPAMVQPIMNPYQRASSANMQAFNTYSNPAAAAANMMNPYNQQVVDATLRDVGNAAMMGQNVLGAQAQAAGAFGGSRHGIAEAEALKGYQQQALDKVGALRQQGYQQSINNAFNAASGLQNVGNQAFGMGNTLADRQMQQGQMQQAAMQNLINAGKQQYAGFTGQPQQNLNALLSTISAQPTLSGESRSFQPGLFNYLQFAAGLA